MQQATEDRNDREEQMLERTPATCTECGHLHYYGVDVFGKCRVCDDCPNDTRSS